MPFRLLILSDVHYASAPAADGSVRRCELGLELISRAIDDAKRRGGFDAVAILGDLLNDGSAADAPALLEAIRALLEKIIPGVPLLVAPGNHDGPAERLAAVFAPQPAAREIGGFRFFTFADAYGFGDICTRREEDRRAFREFAAAGGGPIIVLQHNPMHPPIEADYPYMLTNRPAVMRDYAEAGVLLSLSGHYHDGQELSSDADILPATTKQDTGAGCPRDSRAGRPRHGGVGYYTCQALCQRPFGYAVAHLESGTGTGGPRVEIEQRLLLLPETPPMVDCHAHTEFAYCGTGVSAVGDIDRARTFGLWAICLVEHAPQLYVTGDEFWSAQHLHRPDSWRKSPGERMRRFREVVGPLRSETVFAGLEVEIDDDGQMTLRDADRQWADVLVGALHWFHRDPKELTEAQAARIYLADCKAMLDAGVDILAHPWRLYRGSGFTPTPGLYAELADMLAAAGVAAEINLHITRPEEEFFAVCVQRGVKIATGSDGHRPDETANLNAHLNILRRAAGRQDVADLLWRPRKRGLSTLP